MGSPKSSQTIIGRVVLKSIFCGVFVIVLVYLSMDDTVTHAHGYRPTAVPFVHVELTDDVERSSLSELVSMLSPSESDNIEIPRERMVNFEVGIRATNVLDARGDDVRDKEGRTSVSDAVGLHRIEHLGESECDIPGTERRIDFDDFSDVMGGCHFGDFCRHVFLEIFPFLPRDRESCRLTVSAKRNELVAEELQSADDVAVLGTPAAPDELFAIVPYSDCWPIKHLGKTAGDETEDTVLDRGRNVPEEGIGRIDGGECVADVPLGCGFSEGIEGLDLGDDRVELLDGPEEELEGFVGGIHATGGIDPGPDEKSHEIAIHFVLAAVVLDEAEESVRAALTDGAQSEGCYRAVFVGEGHTVGDRPEHREVYETFGGFHTFLSPLDRDGEGAEEFKGDAGSGEVVAWIPGLGHFWIKQSNDIGDRLGDRMVVGDDRIDAEGAGVGDRLDVAGPAVDGDDELDPFRGEIVDEVPTESVAVVDAMREAVRDLDADRPQVSHEQGG